MSKEQLERKYRDLGIIVQPNVGPRYQGRYSVEIRGTLSVLGTCDTLYEAETLIEDYRDKMAEDAEVPA